MNKSINNELLAMRQQNIGRMLQHAARMYSDVAIEQVNQYGHKDLSLFHTALISNLDVEGTRIVTLAERADMTKQAMGQLVKDLEERGYIYREPDPNDKRASLIKFTDLGLQFLSDAFEIKKDIEKQFINILGEDGLQTLYSLLSQLLASKK